MSSKHEKARATNAGDKPFNASILSASPAGVNTNDGERHGWIKASRSPDALELIRANPLAYVLAAVIAQRAKWREGYTAARLAMGEAYLGDWESYGMSRQQYRTALALLVDEGFATTKATNKGTVARLIGTRLFDVLTVEPNHQPNQRDNHPANHLANHPANHKLRSKNKDQRNPSVAGAPVIASNEEKPEGSESPAQPDRQPYIAGCIDLTGEYPPLLIRTVSDSDATTECQRVKPKGNWQVKFNRKDGDKKPDRDVA